MDFDKIKYMPGRYCRPGEGLATPENEPRPAHFAIRRQPTYAQRPGAGDHPDYSSAQEVHGNGSANPRVGAAELLQP